MTNIISILKHAGPQDLVILDELGAGTDPSEGMGLAVAILETLFGSGAMILATTHYSEIKEFADVTPGFENGSMEFDLESLQPLYRLTIGKAGNSQAFSIALKLGMDEKIINRAQAVTYDRENDYPHVDNQKNTNFSTDVQNQLLITRERSKSKVKKAEPVRQKPASENEETFQIGDRVFVTSLKTAGIIQDPENKQGEFGVFVNNQKLFIHKKRLKLHIESKMLYPENYDMNIVFESKENRKKDKLMSKRHVDGVSIEREE
jgi:dsDNA-specific endonuclease/ATPase MutS2